MRVVFAPVKPEEESLLRRPPMGRSDEIVCFGPGPAVYAEQIRSLPAGWKPDVYLLWSIEYNSIPEGLEESDCLTVGVVGDWNLGGQAFQIMGGVFDMLFADRNGCARLQEAGFENVHYAPLWGFDPQLHRRIPDVPRDLDIVMVGNFNHEVQREREKWLARVARMSRRYRVCLTSNVYGEDYARLMNRAKIVFNRSIRGEINMRAYEAPACGALMFYERENTEIRDLFVDRQECVLYGEDDLEDLLDYYLTHEEERERIAEAGHRRVQACTWAHVLGRILNAIESHQVDNPEPRIQKRKFLSLPPAERYFRRAYHGLLMPNRSALVAAQSALFQAQNLFPNRPDFANAWACLLAEWAAGMLDDRERRGYLQGALEHACSACNAQPDYVTAWFNRAHIHLTLGDLLTAEAALGEAVSLLEADDLRADQLRGPYYPRQFNAFGVELERVWGATRPESTEWTEALRALLLWRAWEELSDLAYQKGRYADAVDFAAEATRRRPDIGTTRHRLARALRAVGRSTEAEAEYRRALADAPLCHEMWIELAELLQETKQYDICITLLEDVSAILDGCPYYESLRPHLQAIRARLQPQPGPTPTQRGLRLLALPDWSNATEWQSLLRHYAQTFHAAEPVTLLLGVDTDRHPSVEVVVAMLEGYLSGHLHKRIDQIPDITLLHRSLHADERQRLFQQADAFVAGTNPTDQEQAGAAGLPILSVNDLDRALSAAAIRKAA